MVENHLQKSYENYFKGKIANSNDVDVAIKTLNEWGEIKKQIISKWNVDRSDSFSTFMEAYKKCTALLGNRSGEVSKAFGGVNIRPKHEMLCVVSGVKDVYWIKNPNGKGSYNFKVIDDRYVEVEIIKDNNGNKTAMNPRENSNIKKDFEEVQKLIKELFINLINVANYEELKQKESAKYYEWYSSDHLKGRILVFESALNRDKQGGLGYILPIYDKKDLIDIYTTLKPEDKEGVEKLSWSELNRKIVDFTREELNIGPEKLSDLKVRIEIYHLIAQYKYNNDLKITESTPNVIFYGSPGTGKTFTVERCIAGVICGDNDRCSFVQCHPGFGYEDFMEGIRPVGIDGNGKIKLEIVNGSFKELCIRAINDLNTDYYYVADEINRANLSEMFGETLSLLESSHRCKDKEDIDHMRETPLCKMLESIEMEKLSSGNKTKEEVDKYLSKMAVYHAINGDSTNGYSIKVLFGIPKNIYFIGMMNDVDKSIDAFDLALRRRFKWIRKDCNYDAIMRSLGDYCDEEDKLKKYFVKRCEDLNGYISKKNSTSLGLGKAYEFGHAYFMRIVDYFDDNMDYFGEDICNLNEACKQLFNEHLRPVLREYLRSYMDENKVEDNLNEAGKKFVGNGYTYESQNTYVDVLKDTVEKAKNVILYGAPGTGKTYVVDKMLEEKNIPPDHYVKVQCHPGFGYEEYMEGIKPTGLSDSGVKFEIINGYFKELCIKAKRDPDNDYYFIADEINRANLSAMFGETLSLIEKDKRYDVNDKEHDIHLRETPLSSAICAYMNNHIKDHIKENPDKYKSKEDVENDPKIGKLASEFDFDKENKEVSGVKFGVPSNVYFIGMMNDVDKSIDAFDLALRRRFVWLRVDFSSKKLSEILETSDKVQSEYIKLYIQRCIDINEMITKDLGKTCEIGHAIFANISAYVNNSKEIKGPHLKDMFDENISPTLKEYYRTYKSDDENIMSKWIKDIKGSFTKDLKG